MQIRLLTAAVLGAMCAGLAHAETIGAPAADVKKGSFGAGVDYGRVDFRLKRDEGFGNGPFNYDVNDMKVVSLKGAYGLTDGAALSFRVGQVSDGMTTGANNRGGAAGIVGTSSADGDLWGLGVDAVVWQRGPLSVGLMARYTEFNWENRETRTNPPTITSGRDHVAMNSTDAALGAGYTVMSSLTPYGGLMVQKIRGSTRFVRDSGATASDSPLKGRKSTFVYAGIRYQTPWKASVGFEMQTNSSWSANAGIQF